MLGVKINVTKSRMKANVPNQLEKRNVKRPVACVQAVAKTIGRKKFAKKD